MTDPGPDCPPRTNAAERAQDGRCLPAKHDSFSHQTPPYSCKFDVGSPVACTVGARRVPGACFRTSRMRRRRPRARRNMIEKAINFDSGLPPNAHMTILCQRPCAVVAGPTHPQKFRAAAVFRTTDQPVCRARPQADAPCADRRTCPAQLPKCDWAGCRTFRSSPFASSVGARGLRVPDFPPLECDPKLIAVKPPQASCDQSAGRR
jgi:hypothetical protein